ncbi:MAG: hypothetical protein LBP22_06610 [Deltaproteobacteria bacterium]|jgi:hypothetical protein|nr:hypothetical protein [Deltaproteobacteria bacterium]
MSEFERKKLEDCFVSRAVYQYRLEKKIDEAFVSWLEKISLSCSCRRDLPRPYFNSTLADGTQIKGVLGDTAIKVVYPDTSAESSQKAFEEILWVQP